MPPRDTHLQRATGPAPLQTAYCLLLPAYFLFFPAGSRILKRRGGGGRINFRPDNLRRGLRKRMAYTKEEAVERARTDLAGRLGVPESEVGGDSVEEADFPNTALGAPLR